MESTEQPDVEQQPDTPPEPVAAMEAPTPVVPPPAAQTPPLAEPGVYVCIHENAGEHAVLGVLEFGTEYDYTATQDPRTLAAVQACVAGGYLEKV